VRRKRWEKLGRVGERGELRPDPAQSRGKGFSFSFSFFFSLFFSLIPFLL
jgi:hypothetical protein